MRQTEVKNTRNKYYHKTARNAMKALRNTSEKEAALVLLPEGDCHAGQIGQE